MQVERGERGERKGSKAHIVYQRHQQKENKHTTFSIELHRPITKARYIAT